MGRVVVKRPDSTPGQSPEGMPEVTIRSIFPGADGMPEVFVVTRAPGFVGPVHSHSQDEVIYVLEGDMTVGDYSCPKGTAIFVERDTMYGPLRSGPRGVTFLNIRQVRAESKVQGRARPQV